MAKILIVDDHPLSRQPLVTLLLSYHGHQPVEARAGPDGLETARLQSLRGSTHPTLARRWARAS